MREKKNNARALVFGTRRAKNYAPPRARFRTRDD
jgi:hypothetical protein